jgi:transposase
MHYLELQIMPAEDAGFVEVAANFPEQCRFVLETLGGVWYHDELAPERKLTPEERLHFHQEHSGPSMQTLKEWMEAQLAERKTEPNSGWGEPSSTCFGTGRR